MARPQFYGSMGGPKTHRPLYLKTRLALTIQWSLYFKTTHWTKKMWSYILQVVLK